MRKFLLPAALLFAALTFSVSDGVAQIRVPDIKIGGKGKDKAADAKRDAQKSGTQKDVPPPPKENTKTNTTTTTTTKDNTQFCKDKAAAVRVRLSKMDSITYAKITTKEPYNELGSIEWDIKRELSGKCTEHDAVLGEYNKKKADVDKIYADYETERKFFYQQEEAYRKLHSSQIPSLSNPSDFNKYMEHALSVNLAENTKRAEAFKKKFPDYVYTSTTSSMESERQHSEEFHLTVAAQYARKNIDEAHKMLREKDPNTSLCLRNFSLLNAYCSAICQAHPNNQLFQNMKKETADLKEQTLTKMRASGIFTSTFHEQNVNKILLSDKPFVIGQEANNTLRTSFTANETIYGIIYFDSKRSGVGLIFKSENETIKAEEAGTGSEAKSYITFEVIPTDKSTSGIALGFTRGAHKLLPRKYDFTISTYDNPVGKVTIDFSQGLDRLEPLYQKVRTNRAASARMPKAAVKDPAVEQKIISAAMAMSFHSIGGITKIHRVVLLEKDWKIERNWRGVITGRSRRAEIAFTSKEDGKCYMTEVIVGQGHNGKDFAGDYSVGLAYHGAEDILLENVNK
jgi:hypothetical protein